MIPIRQEWEVEGDRREVTWIDWEKSQESTTAVAVAATASTAWDRAGATTRTIAMVVVATRRY